MSEITVKRGHLKPTSSQEVVIEDGDWEISVWVHGGTVDIVVNNREDKPIRMADTDTGEKYSFDYARTEVALQFRGGR